MKKAIIKVLSVILVVVLTLTSAPLSGLVGLKLPEWLDFSLEADASRGWTFDKDSGVLTISSDVETGILNGKYTRPWDYYTEDIKKVVFGDNVSLVGWFSFTDCENLSEVIFGKNIEFIEDCAFTNCINLVNVSLPDNVITIGESAFDNTGFYNDINNWENGVLYSGKSLIAANNNIKNKYSIKEGTKVISDDAFHSNNILTDITIPDSVINVGYAGFAWCQNLSNITISDNVLFIGDRSFYGTAFEQDESNWENGALYLEKYLLDVKLNVDNGFAIKNGTKVIGSYAFNSCRFINSLVIPETVIRINKGAFHYCENLEDVKIIGNIKTLEKETFYMCSNLSNVSLPDSLVKINDLIFNDCENLTNVYYNGNEEKWNNILIGNYNRPLLQATIHYNNCNHIFGNWTIITASTCKESGFQKKICVKCYKADTEYITKLNHNIEFDNGIVPTCTESGLTAGEHCSRCDYKIEQTVVDALGHTDGEVVEENYVAPTCTETGSKENVTYCTVCDAETGRKEIIIDATGHTEEEIPAVAPTCTEIGLTLGVKCSVCDEILTAQQELPANGHKYESVVTAPTCTERGYTTYTCACGDSYVDDYTDTLGHDFENGTCTECSATDLDYFTFSIQEPSTKRIRCRDGIVLHANIVGTLPQGVKIEWTSSNNNFSVDKSNSGDEITIISKNNGYTTFTATVYDADNKVIAQDTIEMYSKASFFDKIGGFFRSLFGMTNIYDN